MSTWDLGYIAERIMSLENFITFLFWPGLMLVDLKLAGNEAWVVEKNYALCNDAYYANYKRYYKINS